VSASADQLASRLVSGGRAVTRANRIGVEKACLAGKNVMLANLLAAAGGKRMRGVGKSGSNVNVRYKVVGYQNPVGTISYSGQVHLLNNSTRPHTIEPKRKKALSADGAWAAARAEHPGTRGKNFHAKSEPIVLAQSKRIITQEVRSHLARTFAG
jgi:hypothetical protein